MFGTTTNTTYTKMKAAVKKLYYKQKASDIKYTTQ